MGDPHNWTGCPGMYCQRCYVEPALEYVMGCSDCEAVTGSDPMGGPNGTCDFHREYDEAIADCPPDKAKVAAFKAKWPERTTKP